MKPIEETIWTLNKGEDSLKLTSGKYGVVLSRINTLGGGWKAAETHISDETPEEIKEFYTNPEVGYKEVESNA